MKQIKTWLRSMSEFYYIATALFASQISICVFLYEKVQKDPYYPVICSVGPCLILYLFYRKDGIDTAIRASKTGIVAPFALILGSVLHTLGEFLNAAKTDLIVWIAALTVIFFLRNPISYVFKKEAAKTS